MASGTVLRRASARDDATGPYQEAQGPGEDQQDL